MKLQQVRPRKSAGDRTRRELTKNDLIRMKIPRNFWDARLDKIRPKKSIHRKYVAQYLTSIVKMFDENIGLGLWGANGSGKTAILSMLLQEARRWGFTALFVRAEELRVADLKNAEFEPGTMLVNRALSVDFLGIDDIGKEHRGDTSYAVNLIHGIFRARSDDRLPTLFTTNLCVTDKQFLQIYKKSLIEILRECCQVVCVEGHDFRSEHENRIAKLFR